MYDRFGMPMSEYVTLYVDGRAWASFRCKQHAIEAVKRLGLLRYNIIRESATDTHDRVLAEVKDKQR